MTRLSRLGRAALMHAQAFGWAVFPLQARGKVPVISGESGGKGVKDATVQLPERHLRLARRNTP